MTGRDRQMVLLVMQAESHHSDEAQRIQLGHGRCILEAPPKGEWKQLAQQIGASPEALYREFARRRT